MEENEQNGKRVDIEQREYSFANVRATEHED